MERVNTKPCHLVTQCKRNSISQRRDNIIDTSGAKSASERERERMRVIRYRNEVAAAAAAAAS